MGTWVDTLDYCMAFSVRAYNCLSNAAKYMHDKSRFEFRPNAWYGSHPDLPPLTYEKYLAVDEKFLCKFVKNCSTKTAKEIISIRDSHESSGLVPDLWI